MSHQEKLMKISKLFRLKAQEFLTSSNDVGNLLDIIRHLDSGSDLIACFLTLELIFSNLLKENRMVIEIVPLKPAERTPELHCKEQLKELYEECFNKILSHCENNPVKIQVQALTSTMNLLICEGKCPLEAKGSYSQCVPLNKLKHVVMKILSNKQNNGHLINKFEEYVQYDDLLFYTWKILPSLTAKSNPNDIYIINYLVLLEKLQLCSNNNQTLIMPVSSENSEVNGFLFDESIIKKCLNKIWHCVMLWEHSEITHKKLLIILLERVLPHLDRPLLMTDFLMDSLDMGGPIGLLALQGIFTMIQVHNINYPDIFAKLYSMFEPEIFHTKFKARLFYLSDLFLSSTHLPENLVAAFAKRMARLALVAPSEDIIIICMFIGNLILRHPGLKCLLNNSNSNIATNDPYIMDERDPIKSNAICSSLWEIQTLQNHVLPSVVAAANFINLSLPKVEWDLSKVLDNTGDDIFDKELKKNGKFYFMSVNQPQESVITRDGTIFNYWNL